MFLAKIARRATRDEGSTLIPAIGLMAIALLVTALIGAALISGLGYSTGARASVQSQTAAESGIVQAKAIIESGNCATNGVTVDSTTDPIFHATIWSLIGNSTWSATCPTGTTLSVRIISTGQAQSKGIAGVSSGDSVTVEDIFNYSAGGPVQSGPGLLSFNAFSLNASTITPISIARGDIVLPTGNFACSSGTSIDGNVIVMAGTATVTGTCTITGNVWAKGAISLDPGVVIGGDVLSGTSSLTISSTTHIGGSVSTPLGITIDGRVDGNVTSGTSVTTGATSLIGGNIVTGKSGTTSVIKGKVLGSVSSSGYVSVYAGAKIYGTLTVPAITATYLKYYTTTTLSGTTAATKMKTDGVLTIAVVANPAQPTPLVSFNYNAQTWIHYVYSFAEWQKVGFINEISWPQPAVKCDIPPNVGTGTSNVDVLWQQMQSATVPTVVNALGCTSNLSGDFQVALKTDLVIVAVKFTLGNLIVTSADGRPHKFWMIVPDGPAGTSSAPDCGGLVGHLVSTGIAEIRAPITAMAYGPCQMSLPNNSLWRGQIYTGSIAGAGSTHGLVYSGMGLPGIDLGSGVSAVANPTMTLSTTRNRTNPG